jgi:hypothetical protein
MMQSSRDGRTVVGCLLGSGVDSSRMQPRRAQQLSTDQPRQQALPSVEDNRGKDESRRESTLKIPGRWQRGC